MQKESNTETLILQAARKVFIEKGRQGARMQEIADEAGINKALLHYYFRNKQRLFEAVFIEAFDKFLPRIYKEIESDKNFFEIMQSFISEYIDLIIENPYIPGFVLHELSQNPANIAGILGTHVTRLNLLEQKIQQEINTGNIRTMDPRQIIVNLIGLCIFPFVARPIIQRVFFQGNEEEYQQFLQSRKTEVYHFIYNAIKP